MQDYEYRNTLAGNPSTPLRFPDEVALTPPGLAFANSSEEDRRFFHSGHSTGTFSTSTPHSNPSRVHSLAGDPFNSPTFDLALSPSVDRSANSSMEIFLGPQPPPFVHHRRRLQDSDANHPSPLNPRTAEGIKLAFQANGISFRNPSEEGEIGSQHEIRSDTPPPEPKVSQWRLAQIKKSKPTRLVAGARERPIPLLHGPLSLPYARNPSGVDATVADQSSHMSHVFGLRAAGSPEGKTAPKSTPNYRSRVPSDSTTRTVSGASSLFSHASVATNDTHLTTPSVSSIGSKRPIVVRDLHQNIGIKKNPLVSEQHTHELPPPPVSVQRSFQQTANPRASLGLGRPALSPIPASPTKSQTNVQLPPIPTFSATTHDDAKIRDDIKVHDAAIHSSGSLPLPRAARDETHLPSAEFKTIELVDPSTGTIYAVKVPMIHIDQLVPTSVQPAVVDIPSASTTLPSKADASVNWRSKSSAGPGIRVPETNNPSSSPPLLPVPNVTPISIRNGIPRASGLVLDELCQRIIPQEILANRIRAVKTPSGQAPSGLAPANPLRDAHHKVNIQSPAESPLKNVSKKSRRSGPSLKGSPPKPTRSFGRARGTPGAGKHLKPFGSEQTDDSFSITQATTTKEVHKSMTPATTPRKNKGKTQSAA